MVLSLKVKFGLLIMRPPWDMLMETFGVRETLVWNHRSKAFGPVGYIYALCNLWPVGHMLPAC